MFINWVNITNTFFIKITNSEKTREWFCFGIILFSDSDDRWKIDFRYTDFFSKTKWTQIPKGLIFSPKLINSRSNRSPQIRETPKDVNCRNSEWNQSDDKTKCRRSRPPFRYLKNITPINPSLKNKSVSNNLQDQKNQRNY